MSDTANAQAQPYSLPVLPAFYSTGPFKFMLLSIGTFGLFQLYWFYRNWRAIKQRDGSDIRPLWRAFFTPLWTFSFGAWLNDAARAQRIGTLNLPTIPLGLLYLLSNAVAALPSASFILTFAAGVVAVCAILPFDFAVRRYEGGGSLGAASHPRLALWQMLGSLLAVALLGFPAFDSEQAPDLNHRVAHSHHGVSFELPANWAVTNVTSPDNASAFDEIRLQTGQGFAVLRLYRKSQPPASPYAFTLQLLDELADGGMSVELPAPPRQGAGDRITLESRSNINGRLREGIRGYMTLSVLGLRSSHHFRCYRIDGEDVTAFLLYAAPETRWNIEEPGFGILLESLRIGPAPSRAGDGAGIDIVAAGTEIHALMHADREY